MNPVKEIFSLAWPFIKMGIWLTYIWIIMQQKDKNPKKETHDERQRIERIRGWQYAYLTLVCYLILYAQLDIAIEISWCDTVFSVYLGLAISASVFLAYCVFQDAYFGVGPIDLNKMVRVNLIVVLALVEAIENIWECTILENGMITYNAWPFLIVGLIVVFDISIVIKRYMDKKTEQKI